MHWWLQLKFLSFEELQQRMSNLDSEMEREIYDLRRRYQAKRQPIQDAIDQKKKRQQNFWMPRRLVIITRPTTVSSLVIL